MTTRLTRIIVPSIRGTAITAAAVLAVMAAAPAANTQDSGAAPPPVAVLLPAPLPATRLEGFVASEGHVLTVGTERLGSVAGTSVSVREMRDDRSPVARGLVIETTESQSRRDQSFVDDDEIPALLNGFDALLAVSANPTKLRNFELQYTTRGEFQISASNTVSGSIAFSVRSGRTVRAQRAGLTASELQLLRSLVEAGLQRLQTLDAAR